MPAVSIARSRIRNGSLPSLCIVCGARARHYLYPDVGAPSSGFGELSRAIRFFAYWLSMTGPAPSAAEGSAGLPFCDEHRGYWRRRAWLIMCAPLVAIIVAVAQRARSASDGGAGGPREWIASAAVAAAFVYFVVLLRELLTGVRPTRRDENSLQVSGASREFVEAVEREERVA